MSVRAALLSRLPQRIARLGADQSGVSTIELAIFLPILATLITGAVDLGQGLSQQFTLQQAVNRSLEMVQARQFTAACLDIWDRHRPVLRMRNLKSDEGDLRFLNVRLGFTMPVLDALSEKITLVKAAGRLPASIPSSAFAAVAFAAIERNGAAYGHIDRHGKAEVIEASAYLLAGWMGVADGPST